MAQVEVGVVSLRERFPAALAPSPGTADNSMLTQISEKNPFSSYSVSYYTSNRKDHAHAALDTT